MSNVAAAVREAKEKNPELFCAHPKCLWRIVKRDGTPSPCQNHPLEGVVASFGAERFDLVENAAKRREQHAAMYPEAGKVLDLMAALKASLAATLCGRCGHAHSTQPDGQPCGGCLAQHTFEDRACHSFAYTGGK